MKRIVESNNFMFFRTMEVESSFSCRFYCRFVGLGAGITEKNTISKCTCHQSFRELDRRLIRQYV